MRERGMTYESIGAELGMTRHHASLIVRGLRRGRATPAR
jgi:transcriptional regulator